MPIWLLAVCCSLTGCNHGASVKVDRMLCEYMESPQGLDVAVPRLSWTLLPVDPGEYGQAQSAYRITVSGSEKGSGMWDSGWVESSDAHLIPYGGLPLRSDRTYYWRVKLKDELGRESAWSRAASWSTGIFDPSEWEAKWIGSDVALDDLNHTDCNVPDPWLRKRIVLNDRPQRAVMMVASLGYHEVYVNGQRVGDHVLAPAVSDHSKRARYIAYDIAPYLEKGGNVVALWLGAGWSIYRPYDVGDRPLTPMVMAQADVYYSDPGCGDMQPDLRIVTDSSWKIHSSPNQLLGRWGMRTMGGEIWDANREIPDWNTLDYDDSAWGQASVYAPKLAVTAQKTYTNRVFDRIDPVEIVQTPEGDWRVDMGVNFSGWTNIKVKGEPGQRIDFLFSEREYMDQTFGIHSAYILGPAGEGTFANRFNYSVGRWILIKGLKEKPGAGDVAGWMVRTDFPATTTFECSSDLHNWIQDRVLWTFENLSLGGFTVDCPHRERQGYGGDSHATAETGQWNYRMGAYYTEWMEDWRDVQGRESNVGPWVGGGILPHSAPTYDGGGGPAWGGTVVVLPWLVYLHEGDTRILEENFNLITGWLEFLKGHEKEGILCRYGGRWDFLADWLWPSQAPDEMNNDSPSAECFNSCYYAYNLATAARIAEVLGRQQDAERWNADAEVVRRAVHGKYFDAEDMSYCDRSMGNMVLALLGGVVPDELRAKVMERLSHEVLVVRNGHIDVGLLAGGLMFNLLREEGRDDLLWSMTAQTDFPGWGLMREAGATTLWEMWVKDLPGHSLLHSSFLFPGAWDIDGLGGIRRDRERPGFRHFIVRTPDLKEEQIAWVNASLDSPVGRILSEWKKEDGLVTHRVVIPANSHARVCIPQAEGVKTAEDSGFARPVGSQNGYVMFEAPAGDYVFRQRRGE